MRHTLSKTIRNHTAIAVVDSRGVDVTTQTVETATRPAGKETTITVVVVPITAGDEAATAADEVAYPNHLTRPTSLYAIDAEVIIIGQRIVELRNTCVTSTKRALRTRTRRQT